MQQRRRHRRHTTVAQGMYQGACLVHARAQLVLYNQQQNTTLISSHACSRGDDTGEHTATAQGMYQGRVSSMPVHSRHYIINNKTQHSSLVTHATKATAHTARPWLGTTVICNASAATDPQYTYPYPYYAHTIYVPPTYPWSVSTRLVLTRLPLPSPSTTEDHNANALQLFWECHLRLHYICTVNLSMVVSTRLVLIRLPVLSPSTTEDQNASALQLFSECHLSL